MYSDGPHALRQPGLQRLNDLCMEPLNVQPHLVVVTHDEPAEWHTMTDGEQTKSARAIKACAGIGDRINESIGQMLQYLRKSRKYNITSG